MIKLSTERKWILCPHCGAKHSIYDGTADCHGVFLKCTRGCKKEFELVIENGQQVGVTQQPQKTPPDQT